MAKPRYEWREVVPLKGAGKLDAQRTGEIIANLKSEDKPTELWREAKKPGHYLNGCYEWNVTKAAQSHWRDTSLKIIRAVFVVTIEDDEEARKPAFVSLPVGDRRDFYTPAQIAGNFDLELVLMRAALRDLENFKRRYQNLRGICKILDTAKTTLEAELAREIHSSVA